MCVNPRMRPLQSSLQIPPPNSPSYIASRAAVAVKNLLLRLLGSLQVLVGRERGRSTRHQDEVEGHAAHAGRRGVDGGGGWLGLWRWVVGLGG